MKSKEEIEAKIKALVLQMRGAGEMKHANISGAIDALEWVIGELSNRGSIMQG